jgi:L-seryl-tRNA(Ser) seleniumtransferase
MGDSRYRALPSLDRLLRLKPSKELLHRYRREAVVHLLRGELEAARERIALGEMAPAPDSIAAAAAARAQEDWESGPKRLINATGVILHTAAGRAPLSVKAIAAMEEAAAYSNLEMDLKTGARSSRQDHVRQKLVALTGAESAHVTVNGASAVLLALAALARGREVLISRGQLVEIGGGFRVPVILRQSGARLVEVGTTNRTRVADYEAAISPRTGAILHVHASNFRISGFTENVGLEALAELARRHNLHLISDNGSGALLDTASFGLTHEPMVQEAVAAGCDLVAFSGDKLLGGPQSGLLAGKRTAIEALARHPLARALRPDKIMLAGLSATLAAYLRNESSSTIPVWNMISTRGEQLALRAAEWRKRAFERQLEVGLLDGESTVGGGSLPDEAMPTTLIQLPKEITANALRSGDVSVLARTKGSRTLLDLRTVPVHQEDELLNAVYAAKLRQATVIDSAAS